MEKRNQYNRPQGQTKATQKHSARPLYIIQRGDVTLSLLPAFLRRGAVTVKLLRQDGERTKRLQCKASVRLFDQLDLNAPAGTVLAEAADVLAPEACAELGYREDGKGYTRTLTITALPRQQVQIQIVCTLCVRDELEHLCTVEGYSHVEQIVLPAEAVQQMVTVVQRAYAAMQEEQRSAAKPKTKPRSGRRLDVAYAG